MKKLFSMLLCGALLVGFCACEKESPVNESKQDEHQAVDLGLPSGTLWATCNVGAIKPEECGDYFAWGELEPKLTYHYDNYKFRNNGGDTKYCGNNKTTLEAVDDVATQKWGKNWRIPTKQECNELIQYCSWEQTTVSGVKGYKVTGSNNNSIFLPHTGFYDYDELLCPTDGMYWTSTREEEDEVYDAWYLNTDGYVGDFDCCSGIPVRPVYEDPTITKPTYTVSVEADGTMGTVEGSGVYPAGATAVLTAKANKGYVFVGWSDTNTDNPRTLIVTEDITLIALFDKNTPTGIINNYEYIDLSLPSGTLWATTNIGAEKSTDYGEYFTEDETIPEKKWGGTWRMPTQAEFEELINCCVWEWKTLNGVNGYKISSKTEGNTHYIFLPAAGGYPDWSLTEGTMGYYWGTTNNYLRFDSDHYELGTGIGSRFPVRPVCSSR